MVSEFQPTMADLYLGIAICAIAYDKPWWTNLVAYVCIKAALFLRTRTIR